MFKVIGGFLACAFWIAVVGNGNLSVASKRTMDAAIDAAKVTAERVTNVAGL